MDNYWEHKINYIVNKYKEALKDNKVVYSDIFIGVNNNYEYPSIEAYRRSKVANKIIMQLYTEIDKFPKCCKGIVCAKLKKFKL